MSSDVKEKEASSGNLYGHPREIFLPWQAGQYSL